MALEIRPQSTEPKSLSSSFLCHMQQAASLTSYNWIEFNWILLDWLQIVCIVTFV